MLIIQFSLCFIFFSFAYDKISNIEKPKIYKTDKNTKEVKQVEKKKVSNIYSIIPLEKELIDYTISIGKNNNIDPLLLFAVMQKESKFTENIISSTNDYGIMQINKSNHKSLSNILNVNNFLDAKQNILAGSYKLYSIPNKYTLEQKLIIYNQGGGSAQNSFSNGIYSTQYSRDVVKIYNEYKKEIEF